MILDTTRPRRALTRRALLLTLTPGIAALVALAMLRPAARAQTAPVPIADAPVVPPTAPVTLSLAKSPAAPPPAPTHKAAPLPVAPALPPVAENQAAPLVEPVSLPVRKAAARVAQLSPIAPDPTAPLPAAPATEALAEKLSAPQDGDIAVNLAGVTDGGMPGGPWWSATGALLPRSVFNTQDYMVGRGVIQPNATLRNLVFAFRLPASAQGVTVRYEFPQSVAYSSEGGWPFKMGEQAHETEAQFDANTGGARAVTAVFPASVSKTNIKVGVASGPWQVAVASSAVAAGGVGDSQQGAHKFLFSPASSTTSRTTLSIATDATDDIRVVAVNAQGQELLPEQIGDNSVGTLDQITAQFALPLSQIKQIRVETRPFRWVEFKDVALRPAH